MHSVLQWLTLDHTELRSICFLADHQINQAKRKKILKENLIDGCLADRKYIRLEYGTLIVSDNFTPYPN